MSSSQESYEEIVPDTPSTRKNHLNGSDEPASSPPKKQKRKKQKRKQLCEDTVKEDTTKVMQIYLLRSSSLTGEDIGLEEKPESQDVDDDLETDAGPDESSDEASENEKKEDIQKIVDLLAKIGDEVNEKYVANNPQHTQTMNDLFSKLLQAEAYSSFSRVLRSFCQTLCGVDPDTDSLSFVFHLTQRFMEAAKEAGRKLDEFGRYGERYIMEVYGAWIEERGGWGQVFGEGTAV